MLGFALALVLQVPAQEIDLSAPLDDGAIEAIPLEDLLGSVSAVSRRRESVLKAPATVTVIHRAEIEASSAENVPELLRQVPGVQVVRNGPGNYLVSLRGLGGLQPNNVVVVVDGIPVNSRIDGSIDWATLPVHLANIESIEIVRGPVGSIWGANAYTGVVSITTRAAGAEDTGARFFVSSGVDRAVGMTGTGAASAGGVLGPLAGRISMSATHDRTGTAVDDGATLTTTQPGVDAAALILRARWTITPQLYLDFDVDTALSERGELDRLSFSSRSLPVSQDAARVALTAEDLPFGLAVATAWTRGRMLLIDTLPLKAPPSTAFSYSGAEAFDGDVGADLRFELPRFELPIDASLSLGGNAGAAQVTAPFMHPDENGKVRSSFGGYVNGDVDLFEHFVLSAGVRADRSPAMRDVEFSYRASALFYSNVVGVRLSAASAFREPTYVEVGSRFLDPGTGLIALEGRPDLLPPRIDGLELAVITSPMPTLRIQPTLFVQNVRNLVVEDFDSLVRKTFVQSTDEDVIAGGELEAEWNFLDDYFLDVRFGSVFWPLEGEGAEADENVAPTLAEPELNSRATAYAALRGRWFDGRLGASLGAGTSTPRSYDLRAGIPPRIIDEEIGQRGFAGATIEWRAFEDLPVWLWAKGRAEFPDGVPESPLPGASASLSRVFVGLEYRGD